MRFRELLEAAPDAIIEIDREGRIVLANKATEQLFGYGRAELLAQPVESLIPEEARAGHRAHRRKVLGPAINASHGHWTETRRSKKRRIQISR